MKKSIFSLKHKVSFDMCLKFAKKALFLVLSLCLVSFFVACSDDDDDDDDDDGNGTPPPPTDFVGEGALTAARIASSAGDAKGTITVTGGSLSNASCTSVTDALSKIANDAAANDSNATFVITLTKGKYQEAGQLAYNKSATLKIKGPQKDYGSDVLILGQGVNNADEKGRAAFDIQEAAGDVILEYVTLQNAQGQDTGTAQREVIGHHAKGGRLAAYNCSFLSGQDTLRTENKAWFYKCYIEGDVDFLWMETSSGSAKVALYENCILRAIDSRVASGTQNQARFTAPRLPLTNPVGKGLVIFNSTLQAESNLKNVHLGRNPWAGSKDYYEQVAVVKSKYYGKPMAKAIWENKANGTENQQFIGFKTDSYFPANSNGAILTDTQVTQEYSGRKAILNRVYDTQRAKFQKDWEDVWDIDALITSNSWATNTDSSKDKLDGEATVAIQTYNFDTDSAPQGVSCTGFSKHSSANFQGAQGATITFTVTDKAVVTVTGDYSGAGTIKAGQQGEAYYNFATGSTNKFASKDYVVYGTGAQTVTITATSTTYINKITVKSDTSLAFVPVTDITITAPDNATSLDSKKTLQLSYTTVPSDATNKDVKWAITQGDTVATIDPITGLLSALSATEDTNVTVTATACDTDAFTKTFVIKVLKLDDSAFEIKYLDTAEHSDPTAIAPTNGNASVATGENGTASDMSTWGGWKYNSSKLQTGSTGGLTVTTSDTNKFPQGYDTMYIDFPITAQKALKITQITLGQANHGTGNIKAQVSYKKTGDATFTVVQTDIVTRGGTAVADVTIDTPIALAKNQVLTLRVSLGAASEQGGTRSPTIGTVSIAGQADKVQP